MGELSPIERDALDRIDGAPMLARSTLEGLLQNPRQYGGIP